MKSHTSAAPSFADANSSTQILKQKERQQKDKKLGKKRAQIADADSHWSSGKTCYVIRSEVCTGTKNTIVADYYTSLADTSIGKKLSAQTV